MNKRERLEAAINGDKVDRVPVALWRHWPGDDQRPTDLAAAHINYQQRYDWDFVKVSPASSFCLKDWGIEDKWEGTLEGTRRYTNRVIDNPEDWLSLKVLEPTKGALGEQLECLKLIHKELGQDTPFIQTIFGPMAQARNLAGEEVLLRHMRQNAGQVHHAFQTIADTTVRFINEAKKQGISGIYYAVQLANYSKIGEAEYEVFGRPYDLQILSAANDLWLNVLHLHGPHGMFSLVSDYPVQVFNWHDQESAPDLLTGLQRIKGAASGGVDRDILHDEDPDLSLAQAEEVFEQTGGRRWILGVGCVTLITTPEGNVTKLRALADDLIPE